MTDYWGLLTNAFTAPARAMTAQAPQAPQSMGLLGQIHNAIDPVQAFGGYGGLLAMALPPGAAKMTPMKLYQGQSTYNKGSPFYTGDREWARQFTQSGLDREIASTSINPKQVYKPEKPIYAGDMEAVDAAVAHARKNGFKAVELSEASGHAPGHGGEPASYVLVDRYQIGR